MTVNTLWGSSRHAFIDERILAIGGDHLVTVDGRFLAAVAPAPTLVPIITVDGDHLIAIGGDRICAIASSPSFFQTADVPRDGNLAFGFKYRTQDWQPSDQGGENVFRWAYIALSWSAGATVRASFLVDGKDDAVQLDDGSVIRFVPVTFVLPQKLTGERVTQVFPVPIVRRHIRDGDEIARYYLRGQRLRVTIENLGQMGAGELSLEGIQVDSVPVRKATYAEVDATP